MANRNYYHDYLMHYGVKGQKWGVRRYQNADGSLTDKGKKRYANANKEIMNRSWYTYSEVNALPRKERSATKRYLKDTAKSYQMEYKRQYKNLGGKRGLKKLEYSRDENDNVIVRNKKTGEQANRQAYEQAYLYLSGRSVKNTQRAQAVGAAFLTGYAAMRVIDLIK